MDPNDPRIGLVLDDRYRIVSHIATGSMGVIYRAERLRLGRAVAIKVLHIPLANKEEFIQRFEVEARALSRLSHPNCVSIIDFGVADAPYLVMDYVPGRTLRELVDLRPLPPPLTRTLSLNMASQSDHSSSGLDRWYCRRRP